MQQFWRDAGVALGKYWKFVLLGVVTLALVLGFGLTRLEFATGQDSYLNDNSQVAIDNVAFQDQFGGETVILLFSAEEGRTIADLVTGDNLAAIQQMTADLEEVSEAYAVITPAVSLEFSDALIKGPGRDALVAAAGREDDEARAAARNADIGLSLARLGEVPAEERTLDNPEWTEVLLFGNAGYEQGADGIVAPAIADRSIRYSLNSTYPNLSTAVGGVVLEGNATLDELTVGTAAVIDIVDAVELDGFELTATGSPVYLREINDYLKGGMLTLGLAAFAVMALVLLLLFKVRWRLLPLLSVIVGVLWAFSILGIVGIDLSLVTISGLPILIGLGIDFAIQIHNRVEEEVVLDRADHPMSETLANLAPALIAATVGAVLAFLALQVSQVPMIRDFGVLLAIGVAMLVIAGIVVPTAVLGIREWTAPTGERKDSIVERVVVKLGSLSSGLAIPLILASAALFIVGVAIEGNIKIESDPVRWIDQGSQTVTDIDRLTDETGFASTLGVLVEANNVYDEAVNEVLWDFSLAAEERPEVVSSSSLVGTMGKILGDNPDVSLLTPTPQDMEAAAAVMPPAIARALVSPDTTATQVNLRLGQASLEERAVLVAELEADLQDRIAKADLPADSILLQGLGDDQQAIRAVPSGLAVVGVGLLENLSSNRAILTYLGLAIVALWLILRYSSITRALIALVPVLLAVGVSTIIVSAFGLTLSPLTTVSGPLVIATCAEFSVLILTRYLEERQRGLVPRQATDTASARTGRAFFTSAATTIGGFAVLIGSALPLLRDFGIIVTMNVAVALLAALVVMPPLLVWADEKGLLGTEERPGAVALAARTNQARIGAAVGAVAMAAVVIGLFAAADRESGVAEAAEYAAVPLPTTTVPPPPPPPPTTAPPPTTEPPPATTLPEGVEPPPTTAAPATTVPTATTIDVSQFGTDRPAGLIEGLLFDRLVAEGGDPQRAVCAGTTLLERFTQDELIASGLADFTDESLVPVLIAGRDCGIPEEILDATVATAQGG